jgi:hypothetical protein
MLKKYLEIYKLKFQKVETERMLYIKSFHEISLFLFRFYSFLLKYNMSIFISAIFI